MSGDDLVKRIEQMSEFLNMEAVASTLRIPVETVRDVLAGNLKNIKDAETEKETIIQISTNPVYRQRIISVWRGRGGSGCTSVALHLAYLLEQMMSVLLVDLNATAAGSDVGCLLRQSEYPNMEMLSAKDGSLSQAVIQAETALWVLLPPVAKAIDNSVISRLTIEAREKFDTVIFDLPNTDDEFVLNAVSHSNILVMVTNGYYQEMNRILARRNRAQKETVLVANGCSCDSKQGYVKVVEIPDDRDVRVRMERGIFYKKGSPLSVGAEKIRDAIFGMHSQEKKGFSKVIEQLLSS
jgi:MinD superfamily P-loop ATPase